MTKPRILIVCSNREFAPTIGAQLADREFAPTVVRCESKATEMILSQVPDAVLISHGATGDIDTTEMIIRLRCKGYHRPLVVINARTSTSEEVLLFELGANDVIADTESFPVLVARIRARLRQFSDTRHIAIQIERFVFRPDFRLLVSPNGSRIRLSEKETELLQRLVQADGAPVSRRILLGEVWGDPDSLSHTLETHIYRLRQKLSDSGSTPRLIMTTDRGYRLLRL
ncbi:response regulator transcription factor [Oricola indica]|jgi:DNA-binding response OmpR family regulator|uniref:response regulator transcription factor n=1 Tax=Oricola indica TaxID=2872591 RepID=UPI000C8972EB|nr:DNA-binding response regulator [Ahrensia sp.]